jgi:Ca-activated chloride channel family protein
MSFIWPAMLLLLLIIPFGVWAYRAREQRRAERVARFGLAPAASASAAPGARRGPWARHIPAVLTALGLTILVISLARPQAVIGVPRLEGTVVLVFDVSGSMAADDVEPTRMEAAKAAAIEFVQAQPLTVQIGVVAFSDSGFATQVPTSDRAAIEAAIQRLGPERGTSLGYGILEALAVIRAATDPSTTDYYTNRSDPAPAPTPVPDGVFEPAIIVLLTDGENTAEPAPLEAAQAARERGIRVDTVGIGSPDGTVLEVEGFAVHTQLDESMLRAISERTSGTYHAAAEADDLTAIYDEVGSRLVIRTDPFELTPLFAALGFVLLLIGGLVSLRWLGRMP